MTIDRRFIPTGKGDLQNQVDEINFYLRNLRARDETKRTVTEKVTNGASTTTIITNDAVPISNAEIDAICT